MAETSMRIKRQAPLVRTQVSEILRQSILGMRFKPGERLVERELVELIGVSRTSIREALRELASEGLVRSIPNRGMVVAGLTSKEAAELYELRSSLEGLAGRLFVKRASVAQVTAIRRAFERIRRAAKTGQQLLEAKDQFYDVLFKGAGNEELRSIVASLHARVRVLRSISLSEAGRPAETVAEILAIVEAIERRDAAAASKACSRHVERAGQTALRRVASEERVGGADGQGPVTSRLPG
ncbi:MAG TPA: GntR family transcriptional regulator [Streptosporangiaceae bacterium]